MLFRSEVAGSELFSPELVEQVFSINSIHDDPSIDRPLGDKPEYHAFRAADRLWQSAEGFAIDMARDRLHPKYAGLGERDLALNRLADIERSYAKERLLYPANAPGFFGGTMLRSGAAFDLYSRLVQERRAEYGL